MKAIYPVTITNKLVECKEFYQQTFGFSVVFEADWYVQLLDETSGVEVAFMKPGLDNQPEELRSEFTGGGIIYSLEVADAAKEYERLQSKASAVFYPLTTEEWGQTHFMLIDPAGICVDVVQQAQ